MTNSRQCGTKAGYRGRDMLCSMHCNRGEAVRGHSEFVGKAHKTPRWWLKPRGRDRGGRAGRKPRPRPSPASYAVHEAETVMSGRGRSRARSPTASRCSRVSRPSVWTKINKTTRGGGSVLVSASVTVSSVK